MVEKFLGLFGGEDEVFLFQPIDDTGQGRSMQPIVGTYLQVKENLELLNRQGWGICFCVNELKDPNQPRCAENICRVRAVFVDLDGAPLGPILTWKNEPHCIVESSPGRYHVYWIVKDFPLEEFSTVQRSLAEKFGGDKSVHDLARVMRLPGYIHHKGKPVLSNLIN